MSNRGIRIERTCQVKIMLVRKSLNEREAFTTLGGLKNFFLSIPPLEKSRGGRMPLRKAQNTSISERSQRALAKVRITPRTKHLVSKGVQTMEVVSQDLEKLDTKV